LVLFGKKKNRAFRRGHKAASLKKTYLKLGHLGNNKNPPARKIFDKPALMRKILLLLPLLSACAAPRTDIFAGPLTPQSGTCDPPAQATLTLRDNTLVFAPNSGTLILNGAIAGAIVQAAATLPGADRKPYPVSFQATRQGNLISGTYTTPRCRYHVALHLTGD
jgi:hypothetical protein